MTWDSVIWIAFAAALGATIAEAVGLRKDRFRKHAPKLAWAAAGAAGLSFLWLIGRFIAADVSIGYVFLYTATDVPLAYRIAGAWTGREGSLLLWSVFVALVAAVMAQRHQEGEPDRRWTRLLLFGIAAVFLLATARQGTFAPTDPFFLQGRPDGNGINPTLRSPYILIHPPMMFLAYALTSVPLASALAHMITGGERWSLIAARASRLNFLLYTVAMGLGGLWAYYTLGFGGYWAWDPVEVANFLPWLALTVYLHAQLRHQKDGGFAAMGPLLGVLPFVLTVFSTVSTRTGLWVSVHAFTDPTNSFDPDAAARLLGILDVDSSLLPYFGILLAALLASLALWCRRTAIEHGVLARTAPAIAGVLGAAAVWSALSPRTFLGGIFELASMSGNTGLGALGIMLLAGFAAASPILVAPEQAGRKGISISNLLYVSVLLLGLSLIVAILFHFATVNGWDRAFWETRVPWIVTPIALALTVLMLRHRGKQKALSVAGAALLFAVTAYLLSPRPLGSYAMVLSLVVFGAGVVKWMQIATVGSRRARLGSALLALAALLDLIFWINPPTVFLPGLAWEVRWPVNIPFAIAAALGFVVAHKVALGAERRSWPYLIIGLLGGYYVALPLAAAAWWLHRHPVPHGAWTWKRLRPVGVYGIHLAVGVLFIGYTASTYFIDDERAELALGDAASIAGYDLRFDGGHLVQQPGSPWAEEIQPRFVLERDGTAVAEGSGRLYWEPSTGSHYPLPHTMRLWHRDVFLSVESVCFEADCTGNWTDAYQPTQRIEWTAEMTAVKVQAISLPGLSFVWGSLAMFALYSVPLVGLQQAASRDSSGKKPIV